MTNTATPAKPPHRSDSSAPTPYSLPPTPCPQHPGQPVLPRIDLHVTDVQRAELEILVMERLSELRQELRRKVPPMYQDWLTARLTQLRQDLINTVCGKE